MAKRQVFYSFHYDNDVMRVQQIRNMGYFDGNNPVSPSEWEDVKRKGDAAIKNWIEENMKNRSTVVVLIGSETANRPWVKYEIKQACELGKKLIGIYIHNLKDPRTGTCQKGANPFDQFKLNDGRRLSAIVRCYDPSAFETLSDIKNNISNWIEGQVPKFSEQSLEFAIMELLERRRYEHIARQRIAPLQQHMRQLFYVHRKHEIRLSNYIEKGQKGMIFNICPSC